jgi:hypothetical protein
MRKQFEIRARLVIYLEQQTLNALTAQAKREGRVLVAWVREKLEQLIPNSAVSQVSTDFDTETDIGLRQALRQRREQRVRSSESPTVHTARSNRLTCGCPSCSDYRQKNDIPLGGFPKRAKK